MNHITVEFMGGPLDGMVQELVMDADPATIGSLSMPDPTTGVLHEYRLRADLTRADYVVPTKEPTQ